MAAKIFGLTTLALALAACGHKAPEETALFHGKCQVIVEAKPSDAEIRLDGIHVGEGKAETHITCGEKQLIVHKPGYTPYEAYLPVTTAQPLKVTVELKPEESHPNFALSAELIDQVHKGLIPRDPSDPSIPKDKPQEKIVFADAKGSTGGAAAAATMPAGDTTSVDYWR